ncbi:RNA-binding 19 [Octopus vulgaris]|uniref:RNA-binding 19 n=1 Tax=Octopus vulgaris TaxID=6645 RepID=A0AA36C1D1_OCTVU|nr:RNA-binding 19 [Octopus vulgaris]
MSRLIVKNLPKNMTQERLQEIFGVKGHITNCNLKYTKDGIFRKFAFIGYQKAEDCTEAIKYFNKTFVDTSKIQVEPAYDLGDANKPRSWSKYSAESSNYIYKEKSKPKSDPEKNETDSKNKTHKKNKDEKMKELLGDLYENSEFLEFLEAHKLSGKGAKNMWSNDTIEFLKKSFDSQNKNKGTAEASEVVFDDSGNESADDEYETMAKNTSGDHSVGKTTPRDPLENKMTEDPKPETQPVRYSVRLKGLTGRYHSDTIKEFFYPIKVKQVHIPRGLNHRQFGIVFAEFFNPEDVKMAMEKQGKFINGAKITLKETVTGDDDDDGGGGGHSYKKTAAELKIVPEDEEEEELSESGRLFVRNLPYTCTEEDLEKHFSKYGALVEVYIPLDTATNKMKGFAFITYMIPENAVRALTEMDGTSFQGRLLHIIPSRIKKDLEDNTGHSKDSAFKTKSLQKKKSQAQSSHNWNSLFLGSNAVADVLTEKYGIKKTELLDFETNDSLGVRMALGETQIVTETREFLLENGVSLDSFSQASGPRSKTVILVKNLPAGCKAEELAKVFSKYGTLGRVIFPPTGITAIIEFLSPSEAKKAFTNLAYTKFLHLPLYLEWAPLETFVNAAPTLKKDTDSTPAKETPKEKSEQKAEQSSEDEESDVEPDSVMFVKNLTLETKEDDIRKAFESCGPIRNVIVARKKDLKNQGQALSMGYGFVEFKRSKSAQKAIKKLQHMELNGHQIELKISNRLSISDKVVARKKQVKKKQKTTKILVRNIPFQAKKKEIQELFSVFGELKIVRLPKKVAGTGSHRGFAFVDFVNRREAKKAFNALCHSTHLYGRRLVLEWADTEETIEDLRRKTAEHFHDDIPKKMRKMDIVASLAEETM